MVEIVFGIVCTTLVLSVVFLCGLLVKVIEEDRHPNRRRSKPKQLVHASRPDKQKQRRLLMLLAGNQNAATRLVNSARQRHPGQTEDWYWEKVLYDLERDRR